MYDRTMLNAGSFLHPPVGGAYIMGGMDRRRKKTQVSTPLLGMGVIVASILVFIVLMNLVVVVVRLVMG